MYAHAVSQVDARATGIHVLWLGTPSWIYAEHGWSIQRRGRGQAERVRACADLGQDVLFGLRSRNRALTSLGEVRYGDRAPFPDALGPALAGARVERFELALERPAEIVSLRVGSRGSIALGLRAGKVVAQAADLAGPLAVDLEAALIDTVVVYSVATTEQLEICRVDRAGDDWSCAPYLVRGLQLPIRELMPSLRDEPGEYEEALRRLLPGESVDPKRFAHIADLLRRGVRATKPARPLDVILSITTRSESPPDEMGALDPIRMLLVHPMWRRILGLAYFDADPALVVGQSYEYRVTGEIPDADARDRIFGFHTVPSKVVLPDDFFLGDLHVRLPEAPRVEIVPPVRGSAKVQVGRRAIALRPARLSLPGFTVDAWSIAFELPSPTLSLELDLAPEHHLEYVAVGSTAGRVPDGPRPRLSFTTPARLVLLRGEGLLFGARVPGDPSVTGALSAVARATLVDPPPPAPPTLATVANLQIPAKIAPPVGDVIAPRHALGFAVTWVPGNELLWSWLGLDESAPVEHALFQIEHRLMPPLSPLPPPPALSDAPPADILTDWAPVLPEPNWTIGTRERDHTPKVVAPGSDVMDAFPEDRKPGGGIELRYQDVFDAVHEVRALPVPGTHHRYRIRAVDVVGRPGIAWTETSIVRLEKHVPPPLPAPPEAGDAAAEAPLPVPTGVQARVLVAGDPDLVPKDRALLGTARNAIVLAFGWREQQRTLDPYAREFRVYVTAPLDAVTGSITASTLVWSDGPHGIWDVVVDLPRVTAADAAKETYADNNGTTFRVVTHGGGSSVTLRLEARVARADGTPRVPALGAIRLVLPISAETTRPAAWTERVSVVPITSDETYQIVLFDRLDLRPDHATDALWVGVSAADRQYYVGDARAPAEHRPGNESGVVAAIAQGRYRGRPTLDAPPRLADVPVVFAPEPSNRAILFPLDLSKYVAALGSAESVRPERVPADDLYAMLRVDGTRILTIGRDGTETEVAIAAKGAENAEDHRLVVEAIEAGRSTALDDRYLVLLGAKHHDRDRLFQPCTTDPVTLSTFEETLPPKPGRYLYRFRRADAAGHLSEGAEVAQVVVRVPSLVAPAAPQREVVRPGDPEGRLRMQVPDEHGLTHLLFFEHVADASAATIVRIPNRRDLYPSRAVRLRTEGGTLVLPHAKSLAAADVVVDTIDRSDHHDSTLHPPPPRRRLRHVTYDVAAPPGKRVDVWACALDFDGIPSLLAGPWSFLTPLPLPVPALSVTASSGGLLLTWTWPAAATLEVVVERSSDDATWTRISPPLRATSFRANAASVPVRHRLRIVSPDGRTSFSNVVAS